MSIETQKNFLGKTQTLQMAEIQSERLLSWVRLGIAVCFAFAAIMGFLFKVTNSTAILIQTTAIGVLIFYSVYFLVNQNRRLFLNYFAYVLATLDVTVITIILWSYYLNGNASNLIPNTVFCAYFIAIAFTSFHYRTSLSVYCGLISVVEYSLLYFLLQDKFSSAEPLTEYASKIFILMIVAGLGGIVSRNNSRTILQVVSSEIRYHNLVHRLPEMLFTLDKQGNFLWANMASHSILGMPSKVLSGRSLRSFFVNPDTLRLDTGGIKGTFEILDFNGTHKFVDCVVQVSNEEKSEAAFEGSLYDVTDRELAISQREEMVNRLFQYQKMESLGTLASGMAHDFNNILQTVNDITAMVNKDSKEPETKKRMELISETMSDAKFLIQELFALGRKTPLDYQSININSFLNSIIPHFANQLGPNYSVTLEVSDSQLWIQGDPDYLKRVFQNLIGNARDAMPEGGSITILCESSGENGSGEAVVRVRDTGTGIPLEITEKIFDPFFTTKKPGKGTGLGLALVRRIIMLHNGTITVEKTGYEGTTFKINIPICDDNAVDKDTKTIMLNRQNSAVLLLDDDPKIRDILKFFLKEFKYSVIESSSSEEAVRMLKSNLDSCHVVIMDWKLGNENPHTIIRNLRSIKQDLIVFVVSGYPPKQKSIETMKIQKWFTKPYEKNQLDIEIQRALHRKSFSKSAMLQAANEKTET